jgi:hypothetical protein
MPSFIVADKYLKMDLTALKCVSVGAALADAHFITACERSGLHVVIGQINSPMAFRYPKPICLPSAAWTLASGLPFDLYSSVWNFSFVPSGMGIGLDGMSNQLLKYGRKDFVK